MEKKRDYHLKKIVYGVTEQSFESKINTLFITISVVLQTKFSQLSLANNSFKLNKLCKITFTKYKQKLEKICLCILENVRKFAKIVWP